MFSVLNRWSQQGPARDTDVSKYASQKNLLKLKAQDYNKLESANHINKLINEAQNQKEMSSKLRTDSSPRDEAP